MKFLIPIPLVLIVSVIVSCGEASVNETAEMNASGVGQSLPNIPNGMKNIVAPVATFNEPVLNPRHGAPGHRCDIPVGQPLVRNTAPAAVPINGPFSASIVPPKLPITSVPAPILNRNFRAVANPTTGMSPLSPTYGLNPTSTTSPTTNTVANAAGLNPAHGQPGHRCDIKVGAPLNSPPSTTTNSTTASLPASAATNSATVGVGLNPKHGQPGHRCDIAVGQPLNSAPSKTTRPVSTSPTAASTTPTSIDTTSAASGLNPKHGEPGHRCDIPVGKPLNSKAGAK